MKRVVPSSSRAQLEKKEKEMPQSGNPVSDAFLDGLKKVMTPPSRAQLEKKEQLPQSGLPISDPIIDTLKFMHTASRAQVEQKDLIKKGNSFTQLSSTSNAKDETPQPNGAQSDVIIDVLKKVNNGRAEQLIENQAAPQPKEAEQKKAAPEKKQETKAPVVKAKKI